MPPLYKADPMLRAWRNVTVTCDMSVTKSFLLTETQKQWENNGNVSVNSYSLTSEKL